MAEMFEEDDLTLLWPPSTPNVKMQTEEDAPQISTLPSVLSPLKSSPTAAIMTLSQLVDITVIEELTVASSDAVQKRASSSSREQTGSKKVVESSKMSMSLEKSKNSRPKRVLSPGGS